MFFELRILLSSTTFSGILSVGWSSIIGTPFLSFSHVPIPESSEYETLGGFLMTALQKIPQVGDMIEIEGKRIKIVEMVGQRISKVKLEKLPEPTEET
ncbi:MAG: hypothetical protein JW755_07630 [Candidatus Aminicenantes bacterium]|nr:hypothetical protein [Candidatus Aminicenantes bacterium]